MLSKPSFSQQMLKEFQAKKKKKEADDYGAEEESDGPVPPTPDYAQKSERSTRLNLNDETNQ